MKKFHRVVIVFNVRTCCNHISPSDPTYSLLQCQTIRLTRRYKHDSRY